MRKTSLFVAALLAAAPLAPLPATAQGSPQALYRVDVTKLATGFRASKLIGATVYNDANETVGKIDDLIVNRDDRIPYAIVSVGGFLGMGDHLVAIAYQDLRIAPDRIVLSGATKDVLKTMPKFAYTK
jgi:hypothetical protein